jgi:sec-independent protein translocase protein TatA
MFGVGSQELLIILLAVLLLFGSRRIPEVARSIGSGLQSFRRVVRDAQREIDLELLQEPKDDADRSPRPATGPTDHQQGGARRGAAGSPKRTAGSRSAGDQSRSGQG